MGDEKYVRISSPILSDRGVSRAAKPMRKEKTGQETGLIIEWKKGKIRTNGKRWIGDTQERLKSRIHPYSLAFYCLAFLSPFYSECD